MYDSIPASDGYIYDFYEDQITDEIGWYEVGLDQHIVETMKHVLVSSMHRENLPLNDHDHEIMLSVVSDALKESDHHGLRDDPWIESPSHLLYEMKEKGVHEFFIFDLLYETMLDLTAEYFEECDQHEKAEKKVDKLSLKLEKERSRRNIEKEPCKSGYSSSNIPCDPVNPDDPFA